GTGSGMSSRRRSACASSQRPRTALASELGQGLLARRLELVARAPAGRERRVRDLQAEQEQQLRVLDRARQVPLRRQVVGRLVIVRVLPRLTTIAAPAGRLAGAVGRR